MCIREIVRSLHISEATLKFWMKPEKNFGHCQVNSANTFFASFRLYNKIRKRPPYNDGDLDRLLDALQ
jgi:hypothetical protein